MVLPCDIDSLVWFCHVILTVSSGVLRLVSINYRHGNALFGMLAAEHSSGAPGALSITCRKFRWKPELLRQQTRYQSPSSRSPRPPGQRRSDIT